MACEIKFKEQSVPLSNLHFARLIDFALEVAARTAQADESAFLERMKRLKDEEFWPGRGIDVGADFPNPAEQKFWCRVFHDTARAIFDRQVGVHEHSFWQAQAIYQARALALVFQAAVRESDSQWSADSLDTREFERVVNRKGM